MACEARGAAPVRLVRVLVTAAALCCAGPSVAASWCRQGGVDLLLGGTATARCPAADRSLAAADVRAEHPRVPARTQALRDEDRRAILEEELRTLAGRERELQAHEPSGAALQRTRADLRALRAELARLGSAEPRP